MQGKVTPAVALTEKRIELREFDALHILADGGLLKAEKTGVCGSDWPYF